LVRLKFGVLSFGISFDLSRRWCLGSVGIIRSGSWLSLSIRFGLLTSGSLS
jgi:hypothetical protein